MCLIFMLYFISACRDYYIIDLQIYFLPFSSSTGSLRRDLCSCFQQIRLIRCQIFWNTSLFVLLSDLFLIQCLSNSTEHKQISRIRCHIFKHKPTSVLSRDLFLIQYLSNSTKTPKDQTYHIVARFQHLLFFQEINAINARYQNVKHWKAIWWQ